MERLKFQNAFAKAKPEISRKHFREVIARSVDSTLNDGNPRGHHVLIIVLEELAELSKEVTKTLRGFSGHRITLIEEIADVAVCILYLQEVCGISTQDIYKAMNVKIDRLENKLNERGTYQ